MAAALTDADDDMEERLRDQAHLHEERLEVLQQSVNAELSEMQTQLEDAEIRRQAQMKSAEESSRRAIEGLNERLRKATMTSTNMSTKHDALLEKLSAAQARLDAEIVAHGEAHANSTNLSAKHDAVLQELSALRKRLDVELASRAEAEASTTDISAKHDAVSQELYELQARLDVESASRAEAEVSATNNSVQYDALLNELSALQARLDVELTAHAKAERALADIRRSHRASLTDKKAEDDSKEALQRQLTVLQAECDALSAQNEALASPTPKASGSTFSLIPNSFQDESTISEEVSKLQAQNMELSRQNEFLVKELEEAMARFATRDAEERSTDVAVQVDPVLDHPTSSRKSSASRDSPRAAVPRLQHLRLNSRTERATKTRSLDDALHRTRSERSDLGNVISANEALFELKIQEHVGNLKVVQDQLADEFQQKFAALLSERDETEKKVTARTAAEFAKERRDLFTSYGVGHEDSIREFSAPTRRALRDAEGRLVAEFDRRVMQRKSRIALKHVADIQSLTEDYDRKIAELLNNRSDSIAEPSRIPPSEVHHRHEPATRRERAAVPSREPEGVIVIESPVNAAATPFPRGTPKAYRPQRTLASAPRTQGTIPRAKPFSGRPYVAADTTFPSRVPTGSPAIHPENHHHHHTISQSDGRRTPRPAPSIDDDPISPKTRSNNMTSIPVKAHSVAEKDLGSFAPPVVRTAKSSSSRLAAKSAASSTPKQRSLYSSGAIYMRAQTVQ